MTGDASFSVTAIDGIPDVRPGDRIGDVIVAAINNSGGSLVDGDVLCVASKIVSVAEGRTARLADVQPGECALDLHAQIPRKDARVLQLIIDQTGDPTGDRVIVSGDHVGGWLPHGLLLTSAGVDKAGPDEVLLLPTSPDASAAGIAARILDLTNRRVGVIITDSDGRPDKRGATQVAIGVHGIPPLRNDHGEETLCDMLAAAAAVVMGQRDAGRPVAVLRGVTYTYDVSARIDDAIHDSNAVNIGREL